MCIEQRHSTVKITRKQISRIIDRATVAETRVTFGLRPGDTVRHRDDPNLGLGRVVAKSTSRDRMVLVVWDNGYQQRHDPSVLIKESRIR